MLLPQSEFERSMALIAERVASLSTAFPAENFSLESLSAALSALSLYRIANALEWLKHDLRWNEFLKNTTADMGLAADEGRPAGAATEESTP